MGVRALKTPIRSPTANPFCERLIEPARSQFMDNIIPLDKSHVCRIMKEWSRHYNILDFGQRGHIKSKIAFEV